MSKIAEALRKVEARSRKDKQQVFPEMRVSMSRHHKNPVTKTHLLWGAVVAAVLFFLIYLFGVNQGARLAQNSGLPESSLSKPAAVVEEAAGLADRAKTDTVDAASYEEASSEASSPDAREIQASSAQAAENFFTLQLVTYRNERYAEREAESLAKQGYEVFILPSGSFYQVCIGKFEERRQALGMLQRFKAKDVRQEYHDAYVRRMKG